MQMGHGQVQPSANDEQWEYKIFLLPRGDISGDDRPAISKSVVAVQDEFNGFGRDGWNLSHVIENNQDPIIFVFKRPRQNAG